MKLNESTLTSVQLFGLSDIIASTPGIYGMSSDSFPDVHPDVLTQWKGETYPRAMDERRDAGSFKTEAPRQEPRHDNYGRELPTIQECRQARRAIGTCALLVALGMNQTEVA